MIQWLRNQIVQIRTRKACEAAKRRLLERAHCGAAVVVSPQFRIRVECAEEKPICLGERVHMDGLWLVRGGKGISVGNHCSFRVGTFVGSLYGIEIGSYVIGADHVYISDNNNHPTSPRERMLMTLSEPNTKPWKWDAPRIAGAPIRIEDCVWLGRYCMILKGVTIGRGSIVAAGAVVTKSVPEFSVVAGNPARVVKSLPNDLDPSLQ